MRWDWYRGPAKNGAELRGELYTQFDQVCQKHPKARLLKFSVGPAWEFYCCPDCEETP